MNIKKAIGKIACLEDLTEKEMYSAFNDIMSGKAAPAQIGAFITALRMKGETVDEITGAARVMRKKAIKMKITAHRDSILDTCGTGGTGTKAFNISTAVAFVVAAGGVKVAKHGNRAASGNCGSADVLEELGVKLNVPVSKTAKCINTIGIGFIFAPLFHGAMKYASGPRKEIGIRTIFNILGPLCNPVSAKCQLLGVYDGKLTEPIARVLGKLGSNRAYVVHGAGPLDEVTITGKTRISELNGTRIRTYNVTPADFGLKRARLTDIKGGSVRENARILREVLSGKKGPKRDVVIANAGVAFMASGKAKGFRSAADLAGEIVDSGKALEKLERLIECTNI